MPAGLVTPKWNLLGNAAALDLMDMCLKGVPGHVSTFTQIWGSSTEPHQGSPSKREQVRQGMEGSSHCSEGAGEGREAVWGGG